MAEGQLEKVRVGMLSFAHMHSASYVQCLAENLRAQVAAVYDEDRDRGRNFADRYGARYFPNAEELVKQEIEAVVIGSENSRHRELTELAASYGKHVLCEKPLATTLEDAQAMIAACEAQGVILQTAFPCRFGPPTQRAKQIVESGQLGEILAVKGTNRGRMPGGWFVDKSLSGGGAIIDHTVHVVDLMRWMLACEVTEVYAESGRFFWNLPVEDAGLLTMKLSNGAIATLDTSWSRPTNYPIWGDVTLSFIGTQGVLDVDLLAQRMTVYEPQERRHSYRLWGDNIDAGLIADFVDSVRDRRPPSVTGYDGMKALEVALGAYRSLETGQPVELPLVSESRA